MLAVKDLAIKKALENNWQEACELNEQILQDTPNDIDTLNRLAFAYIKVGKLSDAKKMYQKVISLDKTNPIALKNLKKIDTISHQKIKRYDGEAGGNSNNLLNIQELFIEEAGKTKTVELKNIADKKLLSLLQPGDPLNLAVKRSKIFVQTNEAKYIGMLPDDIGARLLPFIKGGNKYEAYVKSIDERIVCIFIKEKYKSGRFKNQPSFPSSVFLYHGGSE